MYILAAIAAILLLLALVFWLIRRAGKSNASGGYDGGAYGSTDSYLIGGAAANTFDAPGGTSDFSYVSDSSAEPGSGFGGESDFSGAGSGGDFGGDSGGGDSGGDSGGGDGGGGDGGGGE